jgi:hypothetical protein
MSGDLHQRFVVVRTIIDESYEDSAEADAGVAGWRQDPSLRVH